MFPGGSSPACPGPSSQLSRSVCTLPASAVGLVARALFAPSYLLFGPCFLVLNASWAARKPHCSHPFVAIASYIAQVLTCLFLV